MRKDYVKIGGEEFKKILFVSIIFAIMFSLTYVRFQDASVSIVANFMVFFVFIGVLLSLRLLFMKIVAYRNGVEMEMRVTFFNRFWFNSYDTIGASFGNKNGIAMPFVSLVLYILTLGIIIFPSVWNYNMKIIPHRHAGVKQRYEGSSIEGISFYRYGKILFSGFLFYMIFALFLKVFNSVFGEYFYWFLFVIFWIAFLTLAPLIGTEGYDFFIRSKFGWMSSLVVLVVGLLGLFMFNSLGFVIAMGGVAFIVVMLVLLWKDIV